MRRILLIDHPVTQRRDRARTHFEARGLDLTDCCPGTGDALPDPKGFDALVVYGGAEMLSSDLDNPKTAYLRDELTYVRAWIESDRPYVGFCLGGQLMAAAFGAEVAPHDEGLNQIGYHDVAPTAEGRGFLQQPTRMYQWHQEGFGLPDGAIRLATDEDFPNQAIRLNKAFGLQYHPEVDVSHYRFWMDELPHALRRPGAQSREQQLAEAPQSDAKTARWFEDFLDDWLKL